MSDTFDPGAPESAPAEPVVDTAPVDETAPPVQAEDPGPSEQDDPGEGEAPAEKPRGGFQKRIAELTAEKHQARREAEHWREMAMRGQQPPQQTQAPLAEQPLPPDLAQAVGPAPNPADFAAGEYDPAFIRAAARYDMRVDQARMVVQQRHAQARHAQAQIGQRVAQAMEKAMTADPSIAETLQDPSFPVPAHVVQALAEAEMPDAVLAHLARNREEAARIARLSPLAVAREFGRIEARLMSAPAPAAPSAAPVPPRPVRGAAAAVPRDPSQARSMEEYARLRGAE